MSSSSSSSSSPRLPMIVLGAMPVDFGEWEDDYDYTDDGEAVKTGLDPDEIIIPKEVITVAYFYPLSRSFEFEHRAKNKTGFTRLELSKQIMKQYQQIYKDEKMYGVWGHGIEDLILCSLDIDDEGRYVVGVDS